MAEVEYKAVAFEADNVDEDKRIISGYASTWDKDQGGDIIEYGAFSETLSASAGKVKVLWQHDSHTPIGKPVLMREDDVGLYTESYISRTPKGDEALMLAKDGIIDSMSIGFMLDADKVDYGEDGTRHIRGLNLLEFSLVTWPMNEAAVITGVKNNDFTLRDIERVLRDAGLSHKNAKLVAAHGVKSLRDEGNDGEPETDWGFRLKEAMQSLELNIALGGLKR